MTATFEPLDDATGPGEAADNARVLADMLRATFPEAVDESGIDFDVLRDLILDGEPTDPVTERFGLSWPGRSASRRLALLPPTGTLLPCPDESVGADGTDGGWDSRNIVVEGNNLEVLRLLRRAYGRNGGQVDVIYIDPPYNTGTDQTYHDARIVSKAEYDAKTGEADDLGRLVANTRSSGRFHSDWLDMMQPRLWAARDLLKDSGVIIVAIGDDEHAHLRLLLDQVFGAENFLANICWQGGTSALAKHTGGGLDYMAVYAKDYQRHVAVVGQWRTPKDGVDDYLAQARAIWLRSAGNLDRANAEFKAWLTSAKSPVDTSISVYDRFDETGELYFAGDLANGMWRPNLQYDVMHPGTGKAVKRPENGWRHEPERMQANIANGLVQFGPDETTIPTLKRYLKDYVTQVPKPSFYKDRRAATAEVSSLVGEGVFAFPKDHHVLAQWISTVSGADPKAVVIDFFAGSGSTGHAVMDLNAADDGRRQFILVQLDEEIDRPDYGTIADVTRARLRGAGRKVAANIGLEAGALDLGFRSYRLADSNIRTWDGTLSSSDTLDLADTIDAAVDNLVAGRTTEDLLVEMMLRLGVELTASVERREVAGSTLYNLGAGTLFAYFGTGINVEAAKSVADAIRVWSDEAGAVADASVVVRDTGFADSAAKLNLAAALTQAGITNLRSI